MTLKFTNYYFQVQCLSEGYWNSLLGKKSQLLAVNYLVNGQPHWGIPTQCGPSALIMAATGRNRINRVIQRPKDMF